MEYFVLTGIAVCASTLYTAPRLIQGYCAKMRIAASCVIFDERIEAKKRTCLAQGERVAEEEKVRKNSDSTVSEVGEERQVEDLGGK